MIFKNCLFLCVIIVLSLCFKSPYLKEVHVEVSVDEIIQCWVVLQNNPVVEGKRGLGE